MWKVSSSCGRSRPVVERYCLLVPFSTGPGAGIRDPGPGPRTRARDLGPGPVRKQRRQISNMAPKYDSKTQSCSTDTQLLYKSPINVQAHYLTDSLLVPCDSLLIGYLCSLLALPCQASLGWLSRTLPVLLATQTTMRTTSNVYGQMLTNLNQY